MSELNMPERMPNYKVYQREVEEPLRDLEARGLGDMFEITDKVIGFRKGDSPRILLTSCHHAPEIYGTYSAVLGYLQDSQEGVIAVPVVDVPNFCYYKDLSDRPLTDGYSRDMQVCFVMDFIKGYKGAKPRKLPWQYGQESAISPIPEISLLIKECSLVIDIHNCCHDKYLLFTSKTGKRQELDFLRDIVDKIAEADLVYNDLMVQEYSRLGQGVFNCTSENVILSYAAQNNVMNLILEVPVFTKGFNLRNFDEVTRFNITIIRYVVDQFNMLFPRKR